MAPDSTISRKWIISIQMKMLPSLDQPGPTIQFKADKTHSLQE